MRFLPTTFAQLMKPIDRRMVARIVERHDADRYDKQFKTWDHLTALCFAQLGGADSLRELEARWNAQRNHHYHLGARKVTRTTLCDANARRPPEAFLDILDALIVQLDAHWRSESLSLVRLIDSTPIPLDKMCAWAPSNGRIRGLKMHVVYDPKADRPCRVEITLANVNDVEIGKKTELEPGAVYVFDKGYYSFDWWAKIHAAQARFVTRPKDNCRFRTGKKRALKKQKGEGFTLLGDAEVKLASKGDSRLDMPLRLIRVKRDDGGKLKILTNDMQSSAHDIALMYRTRWQIELLFRWLKQHLRLRKFMGRSENAIRIQLLAAMIAFLLLRIAQRRTGAALSPLRFAELARDNLFARRPIARIDKPPDAHPSKPKPKTLPGQLEFCYA